jgi:hypothetical protein
VKFESTAGKVWKHMSREDRLAAARSFFKEPSQETIGLALAALVKMRKMRPQAARALPPDEQARTLAAVIDPGEPLASSLLVSLHLGERRPMLATFLDAAGLPHEDGLLKEDADAVTLTEANVQAGLEALRQAFSPGEIHTYLNTLWLQDPERWALLEKLAETAKS